MAVSPLHDMQLLLSTVGCGANTHCQPAPPPTTKSHWYFLIYWSERLCDADKGSDSRLKKEQPCCCHAASRGRRSSPVCFGPYYCRLYMSHFCTKCAHCVCVCVCVCVRARAQTRNSHCDTHTHTQSDCRQTHVTAKYITEETLRGHEL